MIGRQYYFGEDHTYHANGALKDVKLYDSSASQWTTPATYEYIGGRTLVRQFANGINLDMRDATSTHYDSMGRPTQWNHIDTRPGHDNATLVGFRYAYDRVGNKKWQIPTFNGSDHADDAQRYAYDSAARLTAWRRGEFDDTDEDAYCYKPTTEPPTADRLARRWTLDGVGNWTEVKTMTNPASPVEATESREADAFNQYSEFTIGGTPLAQSHDANGNLAKNTDGTDTYSWDAFNRLSRRSDTSPAKNRETYAYDADGRRVRVDHYDGATLELRVEYSYDGWQVLSEYEAAPTNMICVRQFAYGNYIDEPLVLDTVTDIAATNPNDSTYTYLATPGVWVKWERFYYHQNTLFSVAALSDESGNLAEAYLYDPYGRTIRITDGADADSTIDFDSTDTRATMAASTLGNPYMFTGRRLDDWSGLYNYRHRYYDAERGRFISRDPIGTILQKANLYEYVDGEPVFGLDPYGLCDIGEVRKLQVEVRYIPFLAGPKGGARFGVPEAHDLLGNIMTAREIMEIITSFDCTGLGANGTGALATALSKYFEMHVSDNKKALTDFINKNNLISRMGIAGVETRLVYEICRCGCLWNSWEVVEGYWKKKTYQDPIQLRNTLGVIGIEADALAMILELYSIYNKNLIQDNCKD